MKDFKGIRKWNFKNCKDSLEGITNSNVERELKEKHYVLLSREINKLKAIKTTLQRFPKKYDNKTNELISDIDKKTLNFRECRFNVFLNN